MAGLRTALPLLGAVGAGLAACAFELGEVVDPAAASGSGGATSSAPAATVAGAGGAASSAAATASSTSAASTASGVSAGGGGAGGSGPAPTEGCADGHREAYLDAAQFPDIAACAGAFTVAGVTTAPSQSPQCSREAGDDGAKPDGAGCSVADLCAAGFHVCSDRADLEASAPTDACPPDVPAQTFFLSRETQDAGFACGGGTNNVAGCGSMLFNQDSGCAPFDTLLKQADCNASASWVCPGAADEESVNVVKPGLAEGGALCCRD